MNILVLELPQAPVTGGEVTALKDKNSQAVFLNINVYHNEHVLKTQCCVSAALRCLFHEGAPAKCQLHT